LKKIEQKEKNIIKKFLQKNFIKIKNLWEDWQPYFTGKNRLKSLRDVNYLFILGNTLKFNIQNKIIKLQGKFIEFFIDSIIFFQVLQP